MATSALIDRHVQAMAQGFQPGRAAGMRVTYQLQITGIDDGVWTVSVADGTCKINRGPASGPDTTITMNGERYLALAAGRLDVRDAYQKGDIRVGGNLANALKFVEIFPPWAGLVPPEAPQPAPTPQPAPPPAPAPAPQPAPTPPAVPAAPALADYVRAMPSGFRADKAGGLKAVYQFQLSGPAAGAWTVTVSGGSCTVAEGRPASPSVTINMSDSDFIRLARGELNTTRAYQQGQIKISGDVSQASKIPDIFRAWAGAVEGAPAPAPTPQPAPAPAPQPAPAPVPGPPAGGPVNPGLLNGSFDEYQPYVRDGQAKVWKEDQFPERYGTSWQPVLLSEGAGRLHLMDSGTFGRFTQKYFGGGGRDYHIHGRHSQVVTSRYSFDLVLMQTVAAEPGRTYRFRGSIVSFYKGTGGERGDDKIFKTIGIDPSGGRDCRSAGIIWGERDGKDNEWRYPVIQVKAQANAITVFIRLENVEKDVGQTELNIIHLDDFRLES